MTEILYLDCYLDLPEEIISFAQNLNQILVKKFSSSIDFSEKARPHVTLYMGFFPSHNKNEIVNQVSNSLKLSELKKLAFSKIRITTDGYVFWDLELSDGLLDIHSLVIKCLNPLREGLIRDKYLKCIDNYDIKETANINEYGFPWLFDLYSPHLTLGKINTENFEHEKVRMELEETIAGSIGNVEFLPQKIAVGKVGDNGTVISEPLVIKILDQKPS